MSRYFLCISIFAFMLLSCCKTKQGDLLEIPIDHNQNSPILLSEIAEEITAIELELTDESLLSPDYIQNVIISENEVFIARMNKIYVFSKKGKFIRTIGTQGQGPGEYTYLHRFAFDKKNKRLFISSYNRKIISYDLNGNFIKETYILSGTFNDINYINEKLLLLINEYNSDSKGVYSHSALYCLNDDLQVVDSCTIRDLYFESSFLGTSQWSDDFILKGSKSTYLYYGDFFNKKNGEEKIVRDTLYRFENNYLSPELKLKFKSDGIGKFIDIYNIYRSSRYIFAIYGNSNNLGHIYFFCYDTKTGKGYNTNNQAGNGFMDDINKIEKQVRIRPFILDTEMFYYLHTNMKPDDMEEPNPTLYIGRLKK